MNGVVSIFEIKEIYLELSRNIKLLEITLDKHKANKEPLMDIGNLAYQLKNHGVETSKRLAKIRNALVE